MKRLARFSQLLLATHNANKVWEIAPLLAQCHIQVTTAGALGLPEPDETGDSFWANARLKARAASDACDRAALGEDSGFCIAALGGAPGVYSARWMGPERDSAAAMRRIAREMGEADDRRAWFVCVFCLAWPGGETISFCGQAHGTVRFPPAGERGFGYDPIFVPHGSKSCYAEWSPEAKARDSHRGRAFAQFRAACLPV